MATRKTLQRLPVGRPSLCTNKVIDDIETAVMLGATYKIAALSAGIAEATFYLWKREAEATIFRLDEQQALLEEYEEARDRAGVAGETPPEPFVPDFTVTRHEKQLIKFLHTLHEAEAIGAIGHLDNINRHSSNDPSLSQWILMNRHGYGKATEIVHKGDKENPVVFQDVSDMSIEDRAARVALILQTAERRLAESEKTAVDTNTDAGI